MVPLIRNTQKNNMTACV